MFPGNNTIGKSIFSDNALQVPSSAAVSTVEPPTIIPSLPPSIAALAMDTASSGLCSSGSIKVK